MQVFDTQSTELKDVVRLFYGDERPPLSITCDGTRFFVRLYDRDFRFDYSDKIYDAIPEHRKSARLSKIALYDALCEYTGRTMPWGALTGVRPTKLFYECLGEGMTSAQATDAMRSVYRIQKDRAEVLGEIEAAQRGKLNYSTDKINLYVHVPYCTTRCSYCSFVSLPIKKCAEQSRKYVKLLSEEIVRSVDFLHEHGLDILSVYIGGGTPTAPDDESFDALLDAIGKVECEYTCEAGRPDTITEAKTLSMYAHGVTRVCVNPQTLCERTLEKIGRNHSVEDFYRAYKLVKDYGFQINCDLIAGLYDETLSDFINSFEGVKALSPQNITVHSLSKKNGSGIRYDAGENLWAGQMTDYALLNRGEYVPYYLYRQKRQTGNLENIGFSLPGNECINNITTMEETVGVMACGAGAISKAIGGGKITRYANMRDVPLYISSFDEKIKSKLECFKRALFS